MTCIFCDKENEAKSIEHIVSESFGNKKYVMKRNKVCDDCNGKFSKFENTTLTNSVFIIERARFGAETKKGKNAKGKIKDLTIEGDSDLRKNYLTVKGLTKETFKNFNPTTNIGQLVVSSFDKSEVATSKLLLKIGLESIYTSQNCLFNKYNFSKLKDFLTVKNNIDWPFITTKVELSKFHSIPRFTDKFRLKQNNCELKYSEFEEGVLLFKFKYGVISMVINLLNRNMNWIKKTSAQDKKATLYPEHYRNKLPK